ncbi:selenium-dependent molybdenum cofactor biosynthesis protein YqeB [Romboutsia sedimentorum]|uniref:Selenium-dependent molybdenum cofactor biosynthesis protein YqeB n=1 Tax=Romboutsia sedimentorum TaxID=1368474 RepID=A0ABT7E967_9FIRM|nr:selenium-dependent molybdenum cofactor biosynthesis protein YqeB [Romboutsia sedimentorum]MDK2563458.1 selenium-dependent molybdenum cofactor biosynthesis protein YqeB [Romboutsia sedimentorum]
MENIIIVRGAGDLSSAVMHKLNKCGFKVLALEVDKPLAIRRKVSFCEAVYEKEAMVENVYCKLCKNTYEIYDALKEGKIALAVDPLGKYIEKLKPKIVIDAILAKKNIGTSKNMAALTIALGPGFCAGKDVDVVIETMRGHNLGKIIYKGYALENTGIPGNINGMSKERVVYSKHIGVITNLVQIGDIVKKNQTIAYIKDDSEKNHEVRASIDGVLRGIIKNKTNIINKLKILDIDPRIDEVENCYTISDKARCIAGSVLEVVISYYNNKI